MNNLQRQRHAHELANQHGILLMDIEMPWQDSAAEVYSRSIFCAHIVDETTYAVAMHEIGHLVAKGGIIEAVLNLADTNPLKHILKIQEEFAAWEWARAHACEWTIAMENTQQWAFNTYLHGGDDRVLADGSGEEDPSTNGPDEGETVTPGTSAGDR